MAKKHTARCACGAVKFEFDTNPTFVAVCHCLDCKKSFGVIRSKPDERKPFNVPSLVGKGTNCGCTMAHGEPGDNVGGWFKESVEAVANSTNDSPIGFSGSIMVSGAQRLPFRHVGKRSMRK